MCSQLTDALITSGVFAQHLPQQIMQAVNNYDALSEVHLTNLAFEIMNTLINSDKKFLLLDVRTEGEYQAKHIQNAINIPLSELDNQMEHLLLYTDDNFFIFCRSVR